MQTRDIQTDLLGVISERNRVDALDIISSSADLNWSGISVLRAHSSGFVVENVSAPFHFFFMMTSSAGFFEFRQGKDVRQLPIHDGMLYITPANYPVSGKVLHEYDYIRVGLDVSRLVDPDTGNVLPSNTVFRPVMCSNDHKLRNLLQTLVLEAEAGGPNGKLFVDSLATALSVHYVQNYAKRPVYELSKVSSCHRQLSTAQMKRVKEYMDARLLTSLTLDDISKELGMSKYHFARMFKRTEGTTPYKFYMDLRLEKARVLLDSANISLTEIAHQFNFSDQSHFSRLFKKKYGISPRSYRNESWNKKS